MRGRAWIAVVFTNDQLGVATRVFVIGAQLQIFTCGAVEWAQYSTS